MRYQFRFLKHCEKGRWDLFRCPQHKRYTARRTPFPEVKIFLSIKSTLNCFSTHRQAETCPVSKALLFNHFHRVVNTIPVFFAIHSDNPLFLQNHRPAGAAKGGLHPPNTSHLGVFLNKSGVE